MHSASYVFGSQGFVNQTGGWNNGIAFLFGLLSVQWTVRAGLSCFLAQLCCGELSRRTRANVARPADDGK